MILLKRILKIKHIIAQSICNHSKLEYYYQVNTSKHKNRRVKEKVLYDLYRICKCSKCGKLISKNKVARCINVHQLHYKYGITI